MFFFKKKESRSKAFCPCGYEILQDADSKIYEGGTFTDIICSKCNTQSKWNLDAPVPIYIEAKVNLLPKVEMTDKQFKTVVEKVKEEIAERIIFDYMIVLSRTPLPEELWLKIADINGKYLPRN